MQDCLEGLGFVRFIFALSSILCWELAENTAAVAAIAATAVVGLVVLVGNTAAAAAVAAGADLAAVKLLQLGSSRKFVSTRKTFWTWGYNKTCPHHIR
jgi:hypothetical protein